MYLHMHVQSFYTCMYRLLSISISLKADTCAAVHLVLYPMAGGDVCSLCTVAVGIETE